MNHKQDFFKTSKIYRRSLFASSNSENNKRKLICPIYWPLSTGIDPK